MDLNDLYAREFLYFCANYHFLFMDEEKRIEVCDRLKISQKKLNEVVQYCLDKKYATVFDGKYPYYINPTNSGLAAVGLDEDGGRLPI